MFIALAVAGVMLVVATLVTALVAYVPPGDTTVVGVAELGTAAVGALLAWAGLAQARTAGEFDVRVRPNRPDRELSAVPVGEVSFECPACGRTYRASRQVAGLPFACRACDARFTVPKSTGG